MKGSSRDSSAILWDCEILFGLNKTNWNKMKVYGTFPSILETQYDQNDKKMITFSVSRPIKNLINVVRS